MATFVFGYNGTTYSKGNGVAHHGRIAIPFKSLTSHPDLEVQNSAFSADSIKGLWQKCGSFFLQLKEKGYSHHEIDIFGKSICVDDIKNIAGKTVFPSFIVPRIEQTVVFFKLNEKCLETSDYPVCRIPINSLNGQNKDNILNVTYNVINGFSWSPQIPNDISQDRLIALRGSWSGENEVCLPPKIIGEIQRFLFNHSAAEDKEDFYVSELGKTILSDAVSFVPEPTSALPSMST